MEKEITLTIRVGRKTLVAGAALLILGVWIGRAVSETVTMTTYYPAPAGVYQRLTTTGATILARDSGNVGVGTTSASSKLQVAGSVTSRITGADAAFVGTSGTANETATFGWSTSGFAYIQGGTWGGTTKALALQGGGGNVGVGTYTPSYTLDVNGVIRMNGFIIPPAGADPASPMPGQIWLRS